MPGQSQVDFPSTYGATAHSLGNTDLRVDQIYALTYRKAEREKSGTLLLNDNSVQTPGGGGGGRNAPWTLSSECSTAVASFCIEGGKQKEQGHGTCELKEILDLNPNHPIPQPCP